MVGGLIYLTHTRPDIAFSVGVISRFMHSPSKHHLGVAKRVIRYIVGTIDFGLWYDHDSDFKLLGFTNSDWAGCLEDRKSTSGYVFSLGSAVISWCSKKQATTTLSSSEAEYVAATSAACQAVWLQRILEDLRNKEIEATKIYCDNKSAIAMSKNPSYHGRSKHINLRIHFIRELVAKELITLEFCNTNEQVADIFTKSLPCKKDMYFRNQLGVRSFESRKSVED
ncbi:secreted RxLR effector protein 161-like [Primulina eburnea]|uniref:secreted RxLR effector protein 161-like n=1 Tax=Primulina eburnea TaxID=1245227 RepID=UPI003C6C8C30